MVSTVAEKAEKAEKAEIKGVFRKLAEKAEKQCLFSNFRLKKLQKDFLL